MVDIALKEFLDQKVCQYNRPEFINTDPIQIPHKYTLKEDIEISGFLTATIAWGNRKMILNNATRMMELMGNSPYDFVMNHKDSHLDSFDGFVHRTFNADDFRYFVTALKNVYQNKLGLEGHFTKYQSPSSMQKAIHELKQLFFALPHQARTQKHMADPLRGSAAKRINILIHIKRIA